MGSGRGRILALHGKEPRGHSPAASGPGYPGGGVRGYLVDRACSGVSGCTARDTIGPSMMCAPTQTDRDICGVRCRTVGGQTTAHLVAQAGAGAKGVDTVQRGWDLGLCRGCAAHSGRDRWPTVGGVPRRSHPGVDRDSLWTKATGVKVPRECPLVPLGGRRVP